MNIWIPKTKELVIEPRMPTPRVAGFYKLSAMKPDGRIRPLTGWFPNLITNAGLDTLAAGDWDLRACVGSGNTAPAFTDTQLASLVASTTTVFSSSTSVQSTEPYFATATKEWQFAQGAAAGNLTEVGVGPSPTNLFSRALILDGMGDPTTITVLPNEFLNVSYQLRMFPPLVDVNNSIVLDGVNYDYTIRASRVTTAARPYGWLMFTSSPPNTDGATNELRAARTFTGVIGTITGGPSGSSLQGGTPSNPAYSPGSFNRTSSWTWGINDNNHGIRSIEIGWGTITQVGVGTVAGGRGSFQIGFSAPIPKDNTKQLTLSFNLAWARV